MTVMWSIPSLAVLLPTFASVLIVLAGRHPNLREGITLITAGLLFTFVVSLSPEIMAGERPTVELAEPFPGLSLVLEVEPLGLLFALVASFLWIITSLYSIGYMRGHGEQNQTRFYTCFAVALAAAIGVAFAGNMLTLFVFYEVLTISTYPLVTHAGTAEARQAGRLYLGLLLGTSISFLLLAMIWTWQLTGTLDFASGGILCGSASPAVLSGLLLLYVAGIGKAALMPFHCWLPAAMVAPTPVSALLHAVAVVKAGVFTILKVAIYLFGIEQLQQLASAQWLLYLAAATILLASLIAMTKDNLKARLAYSTISQLSYVVLGALLATNAGVVGSSMHIAMHAFGKITLFFCAGAIMVASHKTEISQMRGLGRTMPITMGAFSVGALSLIGLPPFGGTWSKWFLVLGTLEADQPALLAVLMISSLLNVMYLLPVPVRGFFSPPDDPTTGSQFKEAPLSCVVALTITALGCVAMFLFPDPLFRLVSLIVT
jgi:multicomponent Na+:H+ antiporter subunit D